MKKGNPIMIALGIGKPKGGSSEPPKGLSADEEDESMDSDLVEAAGLVKDALKSGSDEEFAKAMKMFIKTCEDY